jgi:hypothetical protein
VRARSPNRSVRLLLGRFHHAHHRSPALLIRYARRSIEKTIESKPEID